LSRDSSPINSTKIIPIEGEKGGVKPMKKMIKFYAFLITIVAVNIISATKLFAPVDKTHIKKDQLAMGVEYEIWQARILVASPNKIPFFDKEYQLAWYIDEMYQDDLLLIGGKRNEIYTDIAYQIRIQPDNCHNDTFPGTCAPELITTPIVTTDKDKQRDAYYAFKTLYKIFTDEAFMLKHLTTKESPKEFMVFIGDRVKNYVYKDETNPSIPVNVRKYWKCYKLSSVIEAYRNAIVKNNEIKDKENWKLELKAPFTSDTSIRTDKPSVSYKFEGEVKFGYCSADQLYVSYASTAQKGTAQVNYGLPVSKLGTEEFRQMYSTVDPSNRGALWGESWALADKYAIRCTRCVADKVNGLYVGTRFEQVNGILKNIYYEVAHRVRLEKRLGEKEEFRKDHQHQMIKTRVGRAAELFCEAHAIKGDEIWDAIVGDAKCKRECLTYSSVSRSGLAMLVQSMASAWKEKLPANYSRDLYWLPTTGRPVKPLLITYSQIFLSKPIERKEIGVLVESRPPLIELNRLIKRAMTERDEKKGEKHWLDAVEIIHKLQAQEYRIKKWRTERKDLEK
jgi:hypothetical protein